MMSANMKTKSLTFLLALTFVFFLFSGSGYGEEPEVNLKEKTVNQTSLSPEKTYKRNPYFPFYTEVWHDLISGLSEEKYGWYIYLPLLLLFYWMGRTKEPLLSRHRPYPPQVWRQFLGGDCWSSRSCNSSSRGVRNYFVALWVIVHLGNAFWSSAI